MKKIVFIAVMFFSFPVLAGIKVYFTPSKACENSIVAWIEKSQKTIDAAVYSINNRQIVSALKAAHRRGVNIRILTDRSQAGAKSSKVLDLYRYGVNIRINSRHKIEHNKFAVFDGVKVSTGSFNWTNIASDKNSENCLFVTQDEQIAMLYMHRFDELWALSGQKKSDKWFRRRLLR